VRAGKVGEENDVGKKVIFVSKYTEVFDFFFGQPKIRI